MKAVLSCGGTGGHIYPAIAIADKIKEYNPDADILFIGTKKGMENRLVPAAGYEIKGIDASGIDRHNLLNNVKTAKNFVEGSREAGQILENFRPDVVIGTGGYVTGPVVRKAARKGIPCYIHEQNAFPGVANRVLEHYVKKIFISFPEAEKYFQDKSKIILTGNPVRSSFSTESKDFARRKLHISPDDFVLLVFGGSLGAEQINRATLRLIEAAPRKLHIIFITGRRYYKQLAEQVHTSERITLMDYADNMPDLMAAADLLVSRAGAITISEILAMAKPSVLIPSPNVTGNHQYHNARSLADAGAAVLLEEKNMGEDYKAFTEAVIRLSRDREMLKSMSASARTIAKNDATEVIYQNIWQKK